MAATVHLRIYVLPSR